MPTGNQPRRYAHHSNSLNPYSHYCQAVIQSTKFIVTLNSIDPFNMINTLCRTSQRDSAMNITSLASYVDSGAFICLRLRELIQHSQNTGIAHFIPILVGLGIACG